MPLTVHLPSALSSSKEALSVVGASTVLEALRALDQQEAGLSHRLLDEQDRQRKHVLIYVGRDDIRWGDGVLTRLEGDEIIRIIANVSGG